MPKNKQNKTKNLTRCIYNSQSFVHLTWETNRAVLPDHKYTLKQQINLVHLNS